MKPIFKQIATYHLIVLGMIAIAVMRALSNILKRS
jgi:hypothetical protein